MAKRKTFFEGNGEEYRRFSPKPFFRTRKFRKVFGAKAFFRRPNPINTRIIITKESKA